MKTFFVTFIKIAYHCFVLLSFVCFSKNTLQRCFLPRNPIKTEPLNFDVPVILKYILKLKPLTLIQYANKRFIVQITPVKKDQLV